MNCTFLTCICHLYISAISKDNVNFKINEPLFSTSKRYCAITLSVKHCDGRSELALIKRHKTHISCIQCFPNINLDSTTTNITKQTTLILTSVGYNRFHY